TPARSTPRCSTLSAADPGRTALTRTTKGAPMSNHFSADDLKAPGDDRRLDLTDVFCFKSSKDPDKIMLIMCSNSSAPAPAPLAAGVLEFYPGALYRINVAPDGDAHADAAFPFTFSEYQGGRQTGTGWYATGEAARQPEPAGQVLAEGFPVNFDGMAPPIQAGPVPPPAGRGSDPLFVGVEGTPPRARARRAHNPRPQPSPPPPRVP